MISKHYIDRGIKIREEFINISAQLEEILVDIQKVGSQLEDHTNELTDISNNLKGYKHEDEAKLAILNKLTEVEIQGNRLAAIYKPINDNLESLKKQEEILYNTIKENYPNLTDEQIVSEFEPYIKKIK